MTAPKQCMQHAQNDSTETMYAACAE